MNQETKRQSHELTPEFSPPESVEQTSNSTEDQEYLLWALFGAVVVCVFVFITFISASIKSQSSIHVDSAQQILSQPQPAISPPSIGDDVQVGDMRWRVTEVVELGPQIGDPKSVLGSLTAETTSGRFVGVRFEVQNNGDKPKDFSFHHLKIIDSLGREFEASGSGFKTLNPTIKISSEVKFEVAKESVDLKLKVDNLHFFLDRKETVIDLAQASTTVSSIATPSVAPNLKTLKVRGISIDYSSMPIVKINIEITNNSDKLIDSWALDGSLLDAAGNVVASNILRDNDLKPGEPIYKQLLFVRSDFSRSVSWKPSIFSLATKNASGQLKDISGQYKIDFQ
ncbi:MAG: DUF4352 domain-containing protein [Candidatus Hydrogenedentes bacterium]|nr:DUF4352 domain-containing protein [Candidatus Hydrogenedentota bacterium]